MQHFCRPTSKVTMTENRKPRRLKKLTFLAYRILSMTEPSSGGTNYIPFFCMVCRFQNGAYHFCRPKIMVIMTENVLPRRLKKNLTFRLSHSKKSLEIKLFRQTAFFKYDGAVKGHQLSQLLKFFLSVVCQFQNGA